MMDCGASRVSCDEAVAAASNHNLLLPNLIPVHLWVSNTIRFKNMLKVGLRLRQIFHHHL